MSYMSGIFSNIYQTEPVSPVSNVNQTTEETKEELPNILDIDFFTVKYFKKVDHDGKLIQYLKNEIVAYRDKLYYALKDTSSLDEPFEKSTAWNELRNIPNRKIYSTNKPTGYLRSGDMWYNSTTGKTYFFRNINDYPFWVSS